MSERLVCSARGCRAEATSALRWNNPRLHVADRRKVWLACDAHVATLGDFLSLRGFLRDTVPVSALAASEPALAPSESALAASEPALAPPGSPPTDGGRGSSEARRLP
ncbi:MAG TPA: hypothetical protein VES95_00780 [Dermatophilaceae bacterium]|nr:hypothetical protein [Dermatophilaceae bacterium]